MNRYRVILSPDVVRQVETQVVYIAQDSIGNALAWQERLLHAMEKLSDFAGYMVDEEASHSLGYNVRRVVFEQTYLIHFVVDETMGIIRIVNFRHGARLPDFR